jgi:hypothetical protein
MKESNKNIKRGRGGRGTGQTMPSVSARLR